MKTAGKAPVKTAGKAPAKTAGKQPSLILEESNEDNSNPTKDDNDGEPDSTDVLVESIERDPEALEIADSEPDVSADERVEADEVNEEEDEDGPVRPTRTRSQRNLVSFGTMSVPVILLTSCRHPSLLEALRSGSGTLRAMRSLTQKRLPLTLVPSPKRSKLLPARKPQNRCPDALPEQLHVEALAPRIPARMQMRCMLNCRILSALDAQSVLE
jgi:hypothetical protein